jgi:hypothetical protein
MRSCDFPIYGADPRLWYSVFIVVYTVRGGHWSNPDDYLLFGEFFVLGHGLSLLGLVAQPAYLLCYENSNSGESSLLALNHSSVNDLSEAATK